MLFRPPKIKNFSFLYQPWLSLTVSINLANQKLSLNFENGDSKLSLSLLIVEANENAKSKKLLDLIKTKLGINKNYERKQNEILNLKVC